MRCTVEMVAVLDAWADRRGLLRMDAIRVILKDRLDAAEGIPVPHDGTSPAPGAETFRPDAFPKVDLLNLLTSRSDRNVVLTPVVRALFAAGVRGIAGLQAGLDASGIAPPQGGTWGPRAVIGLLQDLGITAGGEAIGSTGDRDGEPA